MDNWSLNSAEFWLLALAVILVVVAITLLLIIVANLYKWPGVKRAGVVGLILCLIISIVPAVKLYKRDWSIPECRDENGELKRENPKCQYP